MSKQKSRYQEINSWFDSSLPLLFCDNCQFCTSIVPNQNRKFSPHYRHTVKYFWRLNHRAKLCVKINIPFLWPLGMTKWVNQLWIPNVVDLYSHFDSSNAKLAANCLIAPDYLHLFGRETVFFSDLVSREKQKKWKIKVGVTHRPAAYYAKEVLPPCLHYPFHRENSLQHSYVEYTPNSRRIDDPYPVYCCFHNDFVVFLGSIIEHILVQDYYFFDFLVG